LFFEGKENLLKK